MERRNFLGRLAVVAGALAVGGVGVAQGVVRKLVGQKVLYYSKTADHWIVRQGEKTVAEGYGLASAPADLVARMTNLCTEVCNKACSNCSPGYKCWCSTTEPCTTLCFHPIKT